ncbi:CDP-alcohol phosphatidyltransferase family protein [Candidatus Chlorohelix sp.]|uniref:CDP-alcohol phosphatidyltransferase family protein n=1 Tax=Candidatus Chlorohelix sp. TaxID=3139201 RepID=UPI0030212F71
MLKQFGGIYSIKPWWQRRLKGIEDALVKREVHPDYVTLSGVAFAGLAGIALYFSAHWSWLALVVAPLVIARIAANALDGLVARRTGKARPWGELYNEFSDRVADLLVLVGLALNPQVIVPLGWGVLVLALLNSYLGTAAKAAGGKRQFGGLLAKADRMIYLALFSPFVAFFGATAWNWLLVVFGIGILITIVQRFRWSYRDLNPAKDGQK